MKPLIIGVDLDGVVADYFNGIRPIACEWLGVPDKALPLEIDYDFKSWGSDKWPGGFIALHKYAVVKKNFFSTVSPIKDAAQTLRALSEQDFRIRIITYRLCMKWHHSTAVKQTIDWLEKHDIPYWDICFIKDKTAVEADVYIEDSPKNYTALKSAGKNVWLFDQGWNRHLNEPSVKNWKEIYDKLQEMK